MSYRDDKKRKERRSFSSPDAFKQDWKEKEKRNTKKVEVKDKLNVLKRENLKHQIDEDQEKSRPTKEKKQEMAEAHERDSSASKFTEKQRIREEKRQSAIKQGEPRQKKGAG